MYSKIVSWNLNGLMSCIESGSTKPIMGLDPAVICFQEIRTQQEPVVYPKYHHFWLHSERDGYAGVLSMSLQEPLNVRYGVGDPRLDREGRLIALEFDNFWSVNAYFPQSHGKLDRHIFRMDWDEALLDLMLELDEKKPVVLCGDFNVTRGPIDFFPENTRLMWAEEGYMSEERDDLETLFENGFTDVFRWKYPEEVSYTWWSNRLNKREENRGWRLDYFVVSDRLLPKVDYIHHFTRLTGSDHCPIMLGAWL